MRVAVIDVGSNTIRLLVATSGDDGVETVEKRQARVGLGGDVEVRGCISDAKISEATAVVVKFVTRAEELGCARTAIAMTSPGRQASNASQLVCRVETETSHAVAVLSGEDEARLAWDGALSRFRSSDESLLVCDVGGGSTELAFGLPQSGPDWHRSIDIGSLRLARRVLANGCRGKKQLAAGHAEVERVLENLLVPLPERAIAVGGSARALGRIAGERLGADQLSGALRVLRRTPGSRITRQFGLREGRTPTVAAGALILAALQRRITAPFEVVEAGLREGLALSLLAQQPVA